MALRALPPRPQRRARHRHRGRLSVRAAVALGLVQGPAEVLPVSSSGHLVLLPALLEWRYTHLDAGVRKAFEVALHAGGGAALGWMLRDELRAALADPAASARLVAPAAVAGLALGPVVEQRLSGARIAACAQIAGGLALAAADASGKRRPRGEPKGDSPRRPPADLDPGHAVGLAQALALVPGVSRNGSVLTAARALGLSREEAARLSWRAGLPVILGAGALEAARLARDGLAPELRAPFAAGAVAAFASTLASRPLLRAALRPYAPLAAYRIVLGAAALRRLHRLQWPRG